MWGGIGGWAHHCQQYTELWKTEVSSRTVPMSNRGQIREEGEQICGREAKESRHVAPMSLSGKIENMGDDNGFLALTVAAHNIVSPVASSLSASTSQQPAYALLHCATCHPCTQWPDIGILQLFYRQQAWPAHLI